MKNLYVVFLALLTYTGWGQIEHPKVSPAAKIEQEVGFTTIKVDYSRPSVRGRKIFGELVPYGRIWRVGANESTKIFFSTDVKIAEKHLSKGTYALYAFPEKKSWEMVFHNNLDHWGDGRSNYDPKEDALRVEVNSKKQKEFTETFLITFDEITHETITLLLKWENTEIRIPIAIETDEFMELRIKEELKKNPTAQTYYEIARYYLEQKYKYKLALGYVDRAINLQGETYYFYRVKSEIQAALMDYSSAIESAKVSLRLANKEGKDEFVRMNNEHITLWMGKMK